MRIFFVFLSGISIFLFVSLSYGESRATGKDLLRDCKKTIKAWDVGLTEEHEHIPAGHCAGYMIGYLESHEIEASLNQKPSFCLPDGTTGPLIIREIVRFLEENPSRLYEARRHLVRSALTNAYPCTEKTQGGIKRRAVDEF